MRRKGQKGSGNGLQGSRLCEEQYQLIRDVRHEFPGTSIYHQKEREELLRRFNEIGARHGVKPREWGALRSLAHRLKVPTMAMVTPNSPEVEAEMEEASRRFKEYMAEPIRDWKRMPF